MFNVFNAPFHSYSTSSSAEEADYRAIWHDWAAVGDDVRAAAHTLHSIDQR